ncbi:outer membrane transport energization protein ExbB [Neolewinella agarilytica]|uniref:Outer membrane transport energization protein ExbB n=2 Tax=Neolewinella agarilytica TaxID=478744 RepID=A0A1H9J1H4_9BACT|nr:MotA/TolQ/ExbB proton channel family protein [Neolewinella agarilytica]SEQ80597.1 outer membrane transport energization protein ExbB [Neolewinella agarilytica]
MLMNFFLLLFQTPELEMNEEPAMESDNILSVLLDSGLLSMVIVAILFVLFIVGLYIFVERYTTIKAAGAEDQGFMDRIRMEISSGNMANARALCATTDSPVARMVDKGLQRIGRPLRDIDAAVENVGNLEIFRLEKGLSTLASIAGAAPMIGFFGTVTGMISAFYEMSTADNITPDVLAGGIYSALLTTAAGLFIGILAFVGYNLLVASVERVVYKMERSTTEFMDLLQEPG